MSTEGMSITNQLVSMRERLDGAESLVRRGRIRRPSSSHRQRPISPSGRQAHARIIASSADSGPSQARVSTLASTLASASSPLQSVDERRASVPTVADVPSPVQQDTRVGPIPSPLPTAPSNEETTQSFARIDKIDEVVVIDGILKTDDSIVEEEEEGGAQKVEKGAQYLPSQLHVQHACSSQHISP